MPLDGVPNSLYADKLHVVNLLKGDVMLGVQGNFIITDPLPIHFFDAKTQLTELAQIGIKRVRDAGARPGGVRSVRLRFHRDPHPTYEWLRERAPVYHNERIDFWALSRFDDVLAGLHDPATYTSTGGVAIEHTARR